MHAIEENKAKELNLHPMVKNNTDNHGTAFTVSIDHIDTTTGISAYERALTIKKVLESNDSNEFRRPGHIFPLIAKSGGVLKLSWTYWSCCRFTKTCRIKASGSYMWNYE